ncbi:MAG: polyprenyl synthetase family protein [Candidatus Poribacteria bacterium]
MKHTEVIEFLQRKKEQIDEYLLNNLPSDHERAEIKQLYDIMRSHPVQGGKGLRSAFCMLICEAFGGNPDDALNTAACLDLLENWLIIHDDIEDGSDIRRGKPCLYYQYGVPIAINVGDALHCQMWKLLQQNTATLGPELTLRILSEFTRASDETIDFVIEREY